MPIDVPVAYCFSSSAAHAMIASRVGSGVNRYWRFQFHPNILKGRANPLRPSAQRALDSVDLCDDRCSMYGLEDGSERRVGRSPCFVRIATAGCAQLRYRLWRVR